MNKLRFANILAVSILTVFLSACGPSAEALIATDAASTAQAMIMEQTVKAAVYMEMTQTQAAIPPTITPAPSNTPLPTASPAPTQTSAPSGGQQVVATSGNAAEFVEETIPDGTQFSPNAKFTKTWRLKNTGTTTWTSDYQIFFLRGNGLGSVSAQYIGSNVGPGTSVVISLDMVAPDTAGTYEGFWMLRAPDGRSFGTGGNNYPISTVIKVVDGSTSTPSKTPTVTPTSTASGVTFAVTNITLSSGIPADGQTCGSLLSFQTQAIVTTNAAGTVKYRWRYDDGSSSSEILVNFTEAGSQIVYNPINCERASTSPDGDSGWVIFEVLSPNSLDKKFDWTYQCTP